MSSESLYSLCRCVSSRASFYGASRITELAVLPEPIESDLNNQVEYDMDEQDQEWLDMVNVERKKSQVGTVSSELFEILMDKLEKEWFELVRNVVTYSK